MPTVRCDLRRQRPLASCASRRPATRSSVASSIRCCPCGLPPCERWAEIREARALVALRDQLEFYRGGSAARAALDALARIAHPSTAGLFAAERLSENDVHRRYAYEALARLGGVPANDAVAFERLLTEERNPEVIGAIAFALAAGGRPYVDRIVQALADRDTADQALDYLVELGHAHPEVLLPHLQHADPGCSGAGGHGRRVHGWRRRRGCAHAVDPRPGSRRCVRQRRRRSCGCESSTGVRRAAENRRAALTSGAHGRGAAAIALRSDIEGNGLFDCDRPIEVWRLDDAVQRRGLVST